MRFFTALLGGLGAGLLLPTLALGQGSVGIGTTAPDASAALEIKASSAAPQGFLPPRLSQANRDRIASPAVGLVVFNTDTGVLNTWNGTRWLPTLADTTPPAPVSFGYTGAPQTYLVPTNVTALSIDMAGAAGGRSTTTSGYGGRVQATLAVTPGQLLTIYVGQAPGSSYTGGYNGGGNSGGVSNSSTGFNGWGGGASDIRTNGTATATSLLTDRVLVAGGGGGRRFGLRWWWYGGGIVGGVGGNISIPYLPSTGFGGGGGTQSGGGSAQSPANPGVDNKGGKGASLNIANWFGGGGGGGYYGGGGGCASVPTLNANGQPVTSGGGGGGGSSYAGAGTSAVTHTQGYQSGNGYVSITPAFALATLPAPYLSGSNIADVIQNTTTQQASSNFNISGNGTIGGNSLVNGDAVVSGNSTVVGGLKVSTLAAGFVASDASGNLNSSGSSSASFIQNSTTQQTSSNFNISGNGTVGGLLTASSARVTGFKAGFVASDASGNLTSSGSTSASFIQNGAAQQTGSNFNISGNGTIGGNSTVSGNSTISGRLLLAAGLNNASTRPALAPGRSPGELAALGQGGTSSPGLSFDDGLLRLSAGGGTAPGTRSYLDLTGYSTVADMNQNIVLGTSGTERLRIVASGNLGIGTSSPAYALDVNGQVRATNVSVTSDARLKQDVRSLTGALAAVQALRGVRYRFRQAEFKDRNLPGGEQVGVLAQELERMYPELVSTDAQGYKSVNYAQLTPVLLEAIKEQQAQLEALRQAHAALQTQTQADHASLQTLQS